MIAAYLETIAPAGACATCIWKALGKPTVYPNGLSPRIGQRGGLIEKGKVHRKTGHDCKQPGHEGIACEANFYGPEIEPAFLED